MAASYDHLRRSHEEIWTMDANNGNDELQLTYDDQGNDNYPTWTRH
jgi:hypothetical protein